MNLIKKIFHMFGEGESGYNMQFNPFEANLPRLNEKEIDNLIRFIANWDPFDGVEIDFTKLDDMFFIASRYVVNEQSGSTSLLMNKLFLSYRLAGYLIDQMELHEIVGPYEGEVSRVVQIADEASLNQFLLDLTEAEKSFFEYNGVSNEYFTSPQIIDFIEEHCDIIKERREEAIKSRQEQEEWLAKDEIKQRILEKERNKQLERDAMSELIEEGLVFNVGSSQTKREAISQDVMDRVWNRDGGKCVNCGSTEKLEFDHIIPISKGGANTYRNLQLLCENCNRTKSNKIG